MGSIGFRTENKFQEWEKHSKGNQRENNGENNEKDI